MNLLQKQCAFSRLLCTLLEYLHSNGYEVTFGEIWRTPEQAKWNAEHGIGIKSSLHILRLAADLNIWKDGVWLQKTSQIRDVGLYWKSLSTDGLKCCWGGEFGDGNHFSVEHNGVR